MPPGERSGEEPVRFLDILTTASSIARSRAAETVAAAHLLDAIEVLSGEVEAAGASGPVSPLGHRRTELGVDPLVQELTQRWFARLGGAPEAEVDPADLTKLRAEIEALVRS